MPRRARSAFQQRRAEKCWDIPNTKTLLRNFSKYDLNISIARPWKPYKKWLQNEYVLEKNMPRSSQEGALQRIGNENCVLVAFAITTKCKITPDSDPNIFSPRMLQTSRHRCSEETMSNNERKNVQKLNEYKLLIEWYICTSIRSDHMTRISQISSNTRNRRIDQTFCASRAAVHTLPPGRTDTGVGVNSTCVFKSRE